MGEQILAATRWKQEEDKDLEKVLLDPIFILS